jgi:hypothetical protein
MSTDYLVGNAMRMEAEFRNWDNNQSLVDPSVIKLIIYDIQFTIIHEFSLGGQNRISEGTYYYLFTPQKEGIFFYEWYVDIDGIPSLTREEFSVVRI